MVTTRRSAADTREHVLRVAHDLFYWNGVRATGIDRVAAEAGVAPTALYRLFGSKDDLVAAYVERSFEASRADLAAATAGLDDRPRSAILAIFDDQAGRLGPEVFRGCVCQMALAEFPDDDAGAHRTAVRAKAWLRERFAEMARAGGAEDPGPVADRLMVVHEGITSATQSLGEVPGGGRALAELVLDAAGIRDG